MPEQLRLSTRLKHAYNAFRNRDPTELYTNRDVGNMSYSRQDRRRLFVINERTIIASVYNRIALDVASETIQHVRLDENGKFSDVMKTGLNEVLTVEANIDQTHRALIQDIVMSMFDEGVVAVVPIETTRDPNVVNAFDILSMRTACIIGWYPRHVRVRVYNDITGKQEEIIVPKRTTAIIENPLYAVMNEQNSTLKRLLKKLAILDAIDEQSGSGKLDLIIQLPYVIKSEARKKQAEERRKEIEFQLAGSKYGIAYTDGTERITQLNRPAENNLMGQIEYLTKMLFSQLGLTESVFDGTADEKTMLNYMNRTVLPIINAITDEFKRKFLTKTARTQNQSIMWFKDPFKLVPAKEMGDLADKYTRNEILTSNEIRGAIGFKPSEDPKANELRNKNISPSKSVEESQTQIDQNLEGG